MTRWGSKYVPDEKTWGESEQAQRAMDALDAMADPSYVKPRRPTSKPVPGQPPIEGGALPSDP